MVKTIQHIATVENVTPFKLRVRMLQGAACTSCQAAQICRSSESREHVIEIAVDGGTSYEVGQQVVIEAPLGNGLRAVWLAYVYPLLCLMLTVTVAVACGLREELAALLGLMAVALAMLTLYLRRERLRRQFTFRIKEMLTQ